MTATPSPLSPTPAGSPSLAQEQSDFTAEGAPPPGRVSAPAPVGHMPGTGLSSEISEAAARVTAAAHKRLLGTLHVKRDASAQGR